MFKVVKTLWILPIVTLAIVGCSETKETLGLEKQAPDEFQVLKHAPLELPPNFTLRPPKPGAPRPQEQAPFVQAKQTVFGAETTQTSETTPTSAEAALLQGAGATSTDPNIREKVDAEAKEFVDDNRPVAQKLLGVFGDDAPKGRVIDPAEEMERLKGQNETDAE